MSKQFRFTKRAIDALPPHDPNSASTDTEYSDTDTKGLRCCVNKKGQKSFLLRYSFNGKKRATKLGDYGPLDVEAARKKAMEIHRKVSDGIDPRATPAASPAVPSFLDFWTKDYVTDAGNRKRSFNDDAIKMKLYMLPVFGSTPIDQITNTDINRYFTGLTDPVRCKAANRAVLAKSTANRHLALLSVIFNLAIRQGLLEKNPCAGIRKHLENNRRERFLTEEELVRFWAALDDENPATMEKNRVAVNVLKLLLLTGTRREEALHATWKHIDLIKREWYIPNTKSGKARTVPLSDDAYDVLASIERHPTCPFVFVNSRTGERYNNPVKAFKRLTARAGIEGVVIHTLRHQFASMAVSSGIPIYTVMSLLGHAQVQTTQRYAHLANKSLRDATNQIGKLMCRTSPGLSTTET